MTRRKIATGKKPAKSKSNISRVTRQLIATRSESFQGPLPPPDILSKYNLIDPSFADRIIRMAETEQNHQHEIDNLMINDDKTLSKRGQWFAFCAIILF